MIALLQNIFAPPKHLILLIVAAWVGLLLAERRSQRHGVDRGKMGGLAFYCIIAFILGGRILFAFQNLSAFGKSPWSFFAPNPDLFDVSSGLVVAILAGWIYGQRHQLALWSTLDALTPFFALLAIGLGISHLAAGTAFGSPTQLPWGIELWNAKRHPTQIYEGIASAITFTLIWVKKP